ncbi:MULTISPECIES: aromatic ring-hydroxylating oxygenase subunit alpha [unclassified Coleofasciculus]|uniref:aromatic ring-hydroxylating dioxygenase subunit alpha n=1 Tax=unclassified Coleofasciculus TaxID=2692782 RepID=UPI00187E0936|nr:MULTISPECIES: aromatic ring-hydroxylating dioxygenase subunit alpha [unclassified Coleofasciculus]MBE9126006.1 aromatic ring-hydroxylating dioxygenase subunit alpha [Coleofasciculus sp. LEGE 07081]MBE9149381.1 aromatic ring-hydroxylating dioxygenase subunit alpha [Coleofasciculus sp. LEGE 07092]
MELATTLTSQTVQNAVREVGINPNYWYPVAWASQLQAGQVMPVVVWQQVIALYRDTNGNLHALEDACPHKGVALHKGQVQGDRLLCAYHGWEFNGEGQCVGIPYLPKEQKLPCARVRSYPVREKYSIIWVFPGDTHLAEEIPFPDVPEFDDPNWLMVPIPARFQAHFSICNENTMDVFHGFLHKNLQGWFNPVLINLQQTDAEVCAEYQVSYQGWMTKFLGLSEQGDQVTTRTVSIRYRYPHYNSSLEGVSSLYLMRLPVAPTFTQSFSLMFLKVRLPQWLLKALDPWLSKFIWRFLLKQFLDQDVEMIESEQQTYLGNRQRRYVEINPAIIALQRVIIRQYEKFVQQSSQPPNHQHTDSQASEEPSVSDSQSIGCVASDSIRVNRANPIELINLDEGNCKGDPKG